MGLKLKRRYFCILPINMNWLKQHLSIIISNPFLFVGIALATLALFGFESDYYGGRSGGPFQSLSSKLADSPKYISLTTYYFYSDKNIILLTIASVLILLGVLKRKDRKHQ